MIRSLYYVFFLLVVPHILWAKNSIDHVYFDYLMQQDTLEEGSLDSADVAKINTLNAKVLTSDSINVILVKNNPYVHIASMLKGNAAGVWVQTPTVEPGTYQNIVVRGLTRPQLSNMDINQNIACVYVNGIPMINEHNFSNSLQRYDLTRLGAATDYLATIDMSTIKSIEVIKDPVRLAELGPLAANGAIWITTYGGISGEREIGVNSYVGVNTKPAVTPYNADYENRFRRQFYDKYRTTNDTYELRYPGYLSDSTNMNYYGAANWRDGYYSNALLYNVDLNVKGGTDRANFAFFAGHVKNAVSSDDANFKRYNVLFNVNMLPFEWVKLSTYINARRSDRDRNRNLRERFTEMAYLPDLSTPISPNMNVYGANLDLYKRRTVDDNITNNLQGNIKLDVDIIENLKFSSSFMLDYNEGRRDLFYPKELMETINYMSTYYGYSQRFIFNNKLTYNLTLDENNQIDIVGGTDYQEDLYRYYFARAFDGPNDYIKLNVVEGNPNEGDYLTPQGGLRVLRWNNKEQFHLQSFYGNMNYSFRNIFDLSAVLRWDGTSTVQQDSRWIFTPAISAGWNIANHFDQSNEFRLRASYGRIGLPNFDSRYAVGPQYTGSLGWDGEPTISSYYGYAGITRNYNRGWIGYGLDWAYSDKMEIALDKSFLNNQLSFNVAAYQTYNKNQILGIPVPAEYGYSAEFKNGMEVKNTGIDAVISAQILANKENTLGWNSSFNFNVNRNELVKLPRGLTELVVGDRLLKVGEAIDSYWLYKNQGIYNTVSEIPTNSSGDLLTMDGVPFAVGDANWKDQNGDNVINSKDKVLEGRSTPKFFGGFNNTLKYKGIQLDFSFICALGHSALNQRAANRYDFINNESSNSLNAVREIFQWQQDLDISKYPIYNVWSNTNPYRVDQDLFLENASYLKLNSLSLGYDLSRLDAIKSAIKSVRRAYVYVNATNLYTVTSFSGNDPELINYNGFYDGYGMPMTKTFTVGMKLDL